MDSPIQQIEQSNVELLSNFLLSHPDIDFVHYYWTNYSNIFAVRVIPKTRCYKLASQGQFIKADAFNAVGFASFFSLPSDFLSDSCNNFYPAWESLRVIRPNHASVMCSFSEERASHSFIDHTKSFQRCLGTCLERTLDYAKSEQSLTLLAGFELEFYLLNSNETLEELLNIMTDKSIYNCNSTAFSMRDARSKCVEACVKTMLNAGIKMEQFHAKHGVNQFEIFAGSLPVLAAVDILIQSQEIIKFQTAGHGFRATFLSKPFQNLASCGMHIHLSMQQASESSIELR